MADSSETAIETGRFDPRNQLPDPDRFDVVIVTGSYARIGDDSDWIEGLQCYIRKRVAARQPTAGVCFGHQLVASALGGCVEALPEGEAGYRQVELTENGRKHPLFEGVPDQFETFLWHLDHVTSVPDGATVLARRDETIQSFALQDAPVVGIQFHPEVTPRVAHELAAQADASTPSGDAIVETIPNEPAEPVRVSQQFYRNLVAAPRLGDIQ
ncbi:glutamine amidotransferase (GMP synthase subunit A) [Haloferax elongans ATCC BAA-1513]|uniref:Glutamine amidotransferase (GMP synthase subunit A) n=1 Tax=Haloferax elongans ATCC BAA-1513 TaxID=1230453 RepID=M0HJA8_HALEO|nr:glutamine amidotransferase (GMP synthase subunit A) [Haloferax elongans ATCC BAA-1513]